MRFHEQFDNFTIWNEYYFFSCGRCYFEFNQNVCQMLYHDCTRLFAFLDGLKIFQQQFNKQY